MPKFVLLWTDVSMWLLVVALVAYVGFVLRRKPNLRTSWRKVFIDAPALCSSLVLAVCLLVTLLDSLHYRPLLPARVRPGRPPPTTPARARCWTRLLCATGRVAGVDLFAPAGLRRLHEGVDRGRTGSFNAWHRA
jgi:hypothetical protein